MAKQEFDLHGHTKLKSPVLPYIWPLERQTYSPREAVYFAKKIRLAGIAITQHDSFEGIEEAMAAGSEYDLIVVPGVEVTSKLNLKFPHILGLGILPENRKAYIPRGKSPEYVIQWIHDQGGVAIAAHPQDHIPNPLSFTSLSVQEVKQYAQILDGVEVMSPVIYKHNSELLIKIATENNLAILGTSDFHGLERWMGLVRTMTLNQCETWMDVISEIKKRNTLPVKHSS